MVTAQHTRCLTQQKLAVNHAKSITGKKPYKDLGKAMKLAHLRDTMSRILSCIVSCSFQKQTILRRDLFTCEGRLFLEQNMSVGGLLTET